MATNTLGRNITFQIYNADGTPFHGLRMKKATVDSVIMSLGDKITGDVYYKDNTLAVTMQEYIEYKRNPNDANEQAVRYVLVNPPTIVREGIVSSNGDLNGMTKYSFEFYHPMYMLGNFPFSDVAVTLNEQRYLSENKSFHWIGNPNDYIAKLNKNLERTEWIVVKSERFPIDKDNELSDVLSFDNNTIADALKTMYDTWGIPYVVDVIKNGESYYNSGKRFKVVVGLPSNEIVDRYNQNYVFQMGKGVGLKNNSRTPRNNKIITRLSGYGSENNIPYGYPQIIWEGDARWEYTAYVNNDPMIDEDDKPHGTPTASAYPLYMGIVGGAYVKLIKHPFTRTHLMPSVYSRSVNKKVNPYAKDYDPTVELVDYYDAIATLDYPYPNEINPVAPSYEIHEFENVKPEMNDGQSPIAIVACVPVDNHRQVVDEWDDTIDDDGNYVQSYFQITLPVLSFDIYACAAITQEMQINMRSGACIGCTFPVQVDWDDYRKNFYDADGNFVPNGEQRDLNKYPKSNEVSINLILQKEYSTFGTIMPNIYQQPHTGDEFVVLGISFPIEYISNAESRLDDEMKSYMLENNVYYFDYPLKFDEFFLATHTSILAQLKPNCVVRFMFANEELQLYVKQLTVKFGNSPLPEYEITLTDNVEAVINQIGKVSEDVEHLTSLISALRQEYSRNVWSELDKKLSRVNSDSAQGLITFVRGLVSMDDAEFGNFIEGIYTGRGGRIDNLGNAELESLRVRSSMEVMELIVNRLAAIEGDEIRSESDTITSVEDLGNNVYKLHLKDKYDGYFTAQYEHNILRGIFNTLPAKMDGISDVDVEDTTEREGRNSYYTSWMRILSDEEDGVHAVAGDNWVKVVLYADEQVPSGKNYKPCPMMNIARWGNAGYTDADTVIDEGDTEQEIAEKRIRAAEHLRRQQTLYLTADGKIMKLKLVNKPIIEAYMYGWVAGGNPESLYTDSSVQRRLIDGRDYIAADGIIASQIIIAEKEQQPAITYVDHGEWDSTTTYLFEQENEDVIDIVGNPIIETSDVWHNGCRWRNITKNNIGHEPSWNSQYWILVEGNTNITMEIDTQGIYSARSGYVDIPATPYVFFGYTDISNDVVVWRWTRESDNAEADTGWNTTHYGAGRIIRITDNDMPLSWHQGHTVVFTCTAYLQDGTTQTNSIIM